MKYSKETQDGQTVVIRYSNRKLYNTVTSKYTTLKELLSLGINSIKVVDHKTKEDITNSTLLNAMTTYFQSNPTELEKVKGTLVTLMTPSVETQN